MEPYCKLYIDSTLDKSQIESEIGKFINGEFDGFSVVSELLEIDVQTNEEWKQSDEESGDSFLYSRYYADVEPCADVDMDKYISIVSDVVRGLQKLGCKVVPSCDFEEQIASQL
jgi:hypothetical protein